MDVNYADLWSNLILTSTMAAELQAVILISTRRRKVITVSKSKQGVGYKAASADIKMTGDPLSIPCASLTITGHELHFQRL